MSPAFKDLESCLSFCTFDFFVYKISQGDAINMKASANHFRHSGFNMLWQQATNDLTVDIPNFNWETAADHFSIV